MFKKSRRKIVAAILSVLVLLLAGTFCIIYLASYVSMTRENQELLNQYVEAYTLPGEQNPEEDADRNVEFPGGERPGTGRGSRPGEPPLLELSTFYSVAISKDGEVLKVDTADIESFDEAALQELASGILESGESSGVRMNLSFRTADKGDYTLVAFLDNTVTMENAATLIRYTLVFGGAALVGMFFLARFLAARIVAPLEESYQKQKQFVSDAGHELKTPVAVVNANVELLSREIGENQWLSNIQYENERMSALILQLLDLARAENAEPAMEPLDFSRLAGGEALPFESVAYESGLVLRNEIADDIWVRGNATSLRQLISILIDNAIRHCSGGREVELILKREKNHAVLSVANAGEAIPPEERKKLFERFYRMDTVRTGENGHYGLGLSIARAIVKAHRGTIEIQCRDGQVIFLVKIPLQK